MIISQIVTQHMLGVLMNTVAHKVEDRKCVATENVTFTVTT